MAYNPAPDAGHKDLQPPVQHVDVPENPAVKQIAVEKAKSNLKQKNRKNNEFTCELPLLLNFYSSKKATLQGFSPDCDGKGWVLSEMTLKFSGKSGSNTTLVFYPDNQQITEGS